MFDEGLQNAENARRHKGRKHDTNTDFIGTNNVTLFSNDTVATAEFNTTNLENTLANHTATASNIIRQFENIPSIDYNRNKSWDNAYNSSIHRKTFLRGSTLEEN